MANYKIVIDYETEIEAKNEQEARQRFWEDIIYDTQNNEATFIDNNLEVLKIKK